ncbi:MAG: hypothetical protein ACK5Z0_06665, partial [Planctomycetota bacterium]
ERLSPIVRRLECVWRLGSWFGLLSSWGQLLYDLRSAIFDRECDERDDRRTIVPNRSAARVRLADGESV